MSEGTEPGGHADLAVNSEELVRIGEVARELRGDLLSKGAQASGSSFAVAGFLGLAGLNSGPGLSHGMGRFVDKILDLSTRCQRIDEHLTGTVATQAALEDDIRSGLRNAQATPALNPLIIDA